jgi:exo-beta-1,3-glucanase (GH17 family)
MRRPTLFVPVLMAGLVVLAWWLPNRPRDAGPDVAPGEKLQSVSFAPYRDGQSPLTGIFPSAAEVEADIALLAPHVRGIRSYAAIEGDYDVAAIAEKHGLKLWQGIWLGGDRAQNRREMDRAIAAARAHPDTVERVIVGNEVLLRRDLPVDELIADIDTVRAAVKQPVTYADVWEFWAQFPQIADHVDLVTIHLLPYWEDVPTEIDRAIDHVHATYERMVALFPGQKIAIGETGWPSRGRARADAVPGRVNQISFIRRFLALAAVEKFDANLIEAFDQRWKQHGEGTVGASWGLWTADRSEKFVPRGKVVENPAWPWDAALGVGLGVLLAAFGHGVDKAVAMAAGAALGWAAVETWPIAYDGWQIVACIVNLAAQALLAIGLVRRVGDIAAGRPVPPPRTGADATRAIRGLSPGAGWFDDLGFLFAWAAAVLQLLLLFDPRYRDFPTAVFAVPLVAIVARCRFGDLPRGGGGPAEACVGFTLVAAAIAGAAREGPLNAQSLTWTVCALVLAAPLLWRLARAG